MTPEDRVKSKICKYLDELHAVDKRLEWFRRQAGGFSYKSGLPDLWGLYAGIHFEIETKAPGGYPSPLQLKWEERLTNAGAVYWRGDNFEDFLNFFKEIVNANAETT